MMNQDPTARNREWLLGVHDRRIRICVGRASPLATGAPRRSRRTAGFTTDSYAGTAAAAAPDSVRGVHSPSIA